MLAYAGELGATLLDKRLYPPHDWFGAEYRQWWQKGGSPADVSIQPRPVLTAATLDPLMAEGYDSAGYLLSRIHRAAKLLFAEIPRSAEISLAYRSVPFLDELQKSCLTC